MVILCHYKKEFTLSVLQLPFMYNFDLETAENEGFSHQLTLFTSYASNYFFDEFAFYETYYQHYYKLIPLK